MSSNIRYMIMHQVREQFPWLELGILSVVLIADSVSLTGLFTYAAVMVIDIGMSPNINQSGYYAGYLAASLMIGRLTSSIPWGIAADTIGRKPVLCVGCMSISIFSLLFGMSTNFWMAMSSRFFMGLLCPIVCISKTVVSEICSKKHEASGMGVITVCWAIGLIIGPAIGGIFAHPVENFPSYFAAYSFLKRYPYFLPNLITSIIAFIAFILLILYFPETLVTSSTNTITTSNSTTIAATNTITTACNNQNPIQISSTPIYASITSSLNRIVSSLKSILFYRSIAFQNDRCNGEENIFMNYNEKIVTREYSKKDIRTGNITSLPNTHDLQSEQMHQISDSRKMNVYYKLKQYWMTTHDHVAYISRKVSTINTSRNTNVHVNNHIQEIHVSDITFPAIHTSGTNTCISNKVVDRREHTTVNNYDTNNYCTNSSSHHSKLDTTQKEDRNQLHSDTILPVDNRYKRYIGNTDCIKEDEELKDGYKDDKDMDTNTHIINQHTTICSQNSDHDRNSIPTTTCTTITTTTYHVKNTLVLVSSSSHDSIANHNDLEHDKYDMILPMENKINDNIMTIHNNPNNNEIKECTSYPFISSSTSTFQPSSSPTPAADTSNASTYQNIMNIMYAPGILKILVTYMLISIISIAFDEVVPLWAMSTYSKGGLDMQLSQIGYIMSLTGIVLIIFTFTLYPPLANYLGPSKSFLIGQILCAPLVLGTVIIRMAHATFGFTVKTSEILIMVDYILFKIATNLSFSSISLVINQSVETNQRASINGIAMTLGSLAKGAGPILGSIIYAWSINHNYPFPLNYQFIFLLLSLISIINFILFFTVYTQLILPKESQSQSTDYQNLPPPTSDEDEIDRHDDDNDELDERKSQKSDTTTMKKKIGNTHYININTHDDMIDDIDNQGEYTYENTDKNERKNKCSSKINH